MKHAHETEEAEEIVGLCGRGHTFVLNTEQLARMEKGKSIECPRCGDPMIHSGDIKKVLETKANNEKE